MAQEFDPNLSDKARLGYLTRMDFGLKGSEGRDRFNKAMKIALQEMMRLWHSTYLPLHFETVAFSRYHGFHYIYGLWAKKVSDRFRKLMFVAFGSDAWKTRFQGVSKLNYDKIKRAWEANRNRLPLYQTGKLRREATGKIRISGSSNRVTGVMTYGRPNLDPDLKEFLGLVGDREFLIGYGADSKATFNFLLSIINEQEEQSLAKIAEAQLKRILEHGDTTMRVTVEIAA